MLKLCLSAKFPHEEIRWDYGIFRSAKHELRFCADSNPARGVSEIRNADDLWKWSRLEIRLDTFRMSTISQKQFIIMIIIIIIMIFIIINKTPFTFWVKHTQDIWNVCLQANKNNRICWKVAYFFKKTKFTGTLCFPNKSGQFNEQEGRKVHLNTISRRLE